MPFKQIIEKFKSNPKQLFLLDGLGAILSAFLLGVVLVRLERLFGIPASTLYFLAAFPVIFAMYDLFCYHQEKNRLGPFLQGISVINLLYCCVSIGFAFYHSGTITGLGWSYILIEIFIVVNLAILEFKVAK